MICYKILLIIFLLTWFILPISMQSINLISETAITKFFHAYSLPFESKTAFYSPLCNFLFWLVYLIPLTVVLLITSFFTKKIKNLLLYIFTMLSLSIMAFCQLSCMMICANTFRWFTQLPAYMYFLFAITVLFHCSAAILGIRHLRIKNSQYAEYIQLYQQAKQDEKLKKTKDKSYKIKTKMAFAVIGSIIIILVAFSSVNLQRYYGLIIETVSDTGRTRAEQTAAVYDSAEGKYDKIASFFETQKQTNELAGIPHDRIDIIISGSSTDNLYLETIQNSTEFPIYNVFAYTTGIPKNIPASEKVITPELAKEYIKRYQSGAYRTEPIYNKSSKTCKYVYPVTLSKSNGHKLIGFSIVTYKEEVLMRPYFQTKVAVFSMALVFFYLSVILTLFLSDYIVNPLLYLRTNVRKASTSLSQMMSGSAKISPSSLIFEDSIKTRDEIKDLSIEIGNMVSLIRGIVPYISVSTLRNAEKETIRSTSRELCFLFTDIRGFTTLCEGLPPKEVVSILNHYLDLETKIILNNGGDVDKFVGDEMMAFFPGQKKEYNACKAAMEIRCAMMEQQKQSLSEGKPVISIGIGINTGKVVFGPVGSKTRMDFTSIGDTVNLAARLEGANKVYGSKSIISESVYVKIQDTFICRELDFITVKGKTEPVRIYEILQTTDKATEKLYDIKSLFEKGLSCYRRKLWDKAELFFTECVKRYKDKPSIVFLERISHFRVSPPPTKWNGVFNMKIK